MFCPIGLVALFALGLLAERVIAEWPEPQSNVSVSFLCL